jgi:triosephosphate isomerase
MHPASTWLVANWKMNGTAHEVRDYAFALNRLAGELPPTTHTVFCPPAAYITTAAEALPYNRRLALGAQNCHEVTKGSYTGEISAAMLADLGCRYVILGHSERRAEGETDQQVAAKAEAALAAGLTPIICLGELLSAYQAKETKSILDQQLAALTRLPTRDILIAYEPVWAIGSGKTPNSQEIAAAHRHIKTVLGSAVAVLYGGSVNAGNASEILRLPEVSGALIGGASLNIASMKEIVAATGTSVRA